MLSVANKHFMLSVTYTKCHAECSYAECSGTLFPWTLDQWKDKTWAEFSTPEETTCITNTA